LLRIALVVRGGDCFSMLDLFLRSDFWRREKREVVWRFPEERIAESPPVVSPKIKNLMNAPIRMTIEICPSTKP
jgi:hypothetical protein